MKTNLLKIAIPLLFTLALLLSAFQNPANTNKLEEKLGQELVQQLSNTPSITFSKLKPAMRYPNITQVEPIGPSVVLTPDQVQQLNSLLLNDSTYLFDMTKKCIFIPHHLFTYHTANGDVAILIDDSNKQLIFNANGSSTTLDFDPAADQLITFINNIPNP